MTERKEHWENVFSTKTETEVSWYQKQPKTSIHLQRLSCHFPFRLAHDVEAELL